MKTEKAWAIVEKSTGRIARWWTGAEGQELQLDVYATKKDCLLSLEEWNKNVGPHEIVRVEIKAVK